MFVHAGYRFAGSGSAHAPHVLPPRHKVQFGWIRAYIENKDPAHLGEKGRYPIGVLHSQHVSCTFARWSALYGFTALACSATPCRQRSYPPPGTHRRASKAYRSPAAAVRAAHESQWFGDARNDLNVRLKHLEILCYDKTAG